MRIDGKKNNGKCSCGQKHAMTTELCVIEAGCMKNADKYIKEFGLDGFSVAIYDENTYRATKGSFLGADMEIILPSKDLHADNRGVSLAMEKIPQNCNYLIAIGAGTIHDITRYCAHQKNIPFVSCPTAASVDGFCSSVAAMTWNGFKKTFQAVAPKIVIADIDIISKAPAFLTNSGFGDMIGKFIALTDWKISHILTNEHFCPIIHDMTMKATKAVVQSAAAIKHGDPPALEKLMYGLLMSGLAMQLLGNSRCASGAEHHISHLIEMKPEVLSVKSDALHGEKVGVGTLLACQEYHKMRESKTISWRDYPEIKEDYIKNIFAEKLGEAIIEENKNNCATEVTAKSISENWNNICEVIDTIPPYEDMVESFNIIGAKSTLDEIGVSEEKLDRILEYSPLVRNRLTLMRLRRAMEEK